jgi:putative ATP-dependent endonuclease of OLD family
MVVDEIERGLESYRQRILMEELVASPSQVFVTSHSAPAVSAASGANLWYLDSGGAIGRIDSSLRKQQKRDPEAFLARLSIIAEGATEVGFVTDLINRSLKEDMRRYGVWVSDGNSNTEALAILKAMSEGGMTVGGFVDNEGTDNGNWQEVKKKLGDLLMRWPNGGLEENLIRHLSDENLHGFIRDPDGDDGDRLRTMADRLGLQDKSFAAVTAAAPDIRELMIQAASGTAPTDPDAPRDQKKAWKKHGQQWFKSVVGGHELATKMFALGLWPAAQGQLLPFVNAVRTAVGLENVLTVD